MIYWEEENKQILSPLCLNCRDPYFAPYSEDLPHVGCCSYSPIFTLFEIHKMLKADPAFFWEHIYHHPHREIGHYSITVHARVNELFFEMDRTHLSRLEEEDLRLQFSVCPFFVANKGCGLHPRFKNVTCRSFICSAIENRLEQAQKENLVQWVTQIRLEAEEFVSKHQKVLMDKGWNLKSNIKEVVHYLTDL